MKNWDDILKSKLSTYTYDEELSQEKVDFFFNEMHSDSETSRVSLTKYTWFKMAATVLLFCGITALTLQFSEVTVSASNTMIEDITLPDGSKVMLNAKSELSYNKVLWLFNRDINLEGEAFFDVEKGSVFNVVSSNGVTQVLGTSFNIYSRNNLYNVRCYTGKVKVKSGNEEKVITPSEGVSFEYDKSIDSFQFDATKNDWRSGEFYFDNKDLEYVFQEFVLHYDVKINLTGEIRKMKYSGYFPVKNMELALKLICDPMGLNYEINNEKFVDIKLNID